MSTTTTPKSSVLFDLAVKPEFGEPLIPVSATGRTAKPTATEQALETLHSGVAELMSSAGWQAALEMKAQFHHYSFFNTSLILAQCPDATLVAGYKRWQKMGRYVKKGEKGIAILAPLIKKDPDDPDECVVYGFKTVHVYDIQQTEGDPLPEADTPTLLEGDGEEIENALLALETFAKGEGIEVRYDFDHVSALGVYRLALKQIALRPDLSPLQRLKTLVHELAHALLHDLITDRECAELEAESCAYLTLHSLGMDTSAYSFAYLAHWAGSLEALVAAGERAGKAAKQLLDVLQPAEL